MVSIRCYSVHCGSTNCRIGHNADCDSSVYCGEALLLRQMLERFAVPIKIRDHAKQRERR